MEPWMGLNFYDYHDLQKNQGGYRIMKHTVIYCCLYSHSIQFLQALTSLCMSSQQGPSLYKGQEISNMMSMHTIYDNGLQDHAHPPGLPDPLLPAGRLPLYTLPAGRTRARARTHTRTHKLLSPSFSQQAEPYLK
jgi:hypothetical protein